MKPSGIGGMAVMEGVMMKNKDTYAIAVRKPNNEIAVEKNTHKDFSDKVKLFKLPIFRGILAFVDSMVIGVKVLNYSASFFDEEEDTSKAKKKNKKTEKKNIDNANEDIDFIVEDASVNNVDAANHVTIQDKDKKDDKKEETGSPLLMALAVVISIVISVSLFMVLPVIITNFFSSLITNHIWIAFIEGIVRLSIFIGYVILASRMNEIKRVFMYHGAEHKTINCLENGFELTVENVKWQSKEHKRCGTSFMLLVMLISLLFFMVLPSMNVLWRIASRVILVPFIAGVSYEFIRFAGKSESKIVDIISKPGLWMQGLTTKEPDDTMIEVAIESVGAVFDWKEFLQNSEIKQTKTKSKHEKSSQAVLKENSKKQEDKKEAVTETHTVKKQNASINQMAAAKQTNSIKHAESTKKTANVQSTSTSSEEEDDEILRALDKFFDSGLNNTNKDKGN